MPLLFVFQLLLCAAAVDLYLPAFPQIRSEFSISDTECLFQVSCHTFGAFFSRFFIGPVADAFQKRSTFLVMAVLSASGQFLSAIATSFPFLLFARFLIALGIGSLYVLSSLLLAKSAQKKIAGYNLTFLSFSTGVIAAPFAAAAMMQWFGWHWRALFACAGVLQTLAIPACFFIAKDPAISSSFTSLFQQAFQKYKRVVYAKRTWIHLFWGMSFVSQYLAYISQVPFALKNIGCSLQTITIILALPSFASLLFGIFWGRIFILKAESDLVRLGIAIHGTFILLSASCFLFSAQLSLPLLIILIVLQSLLGSLLLPLCLSQAIQTLPEEEATLVSVASMARSVLSTLMISLCALLFTTHPLSLYLIFTCTSLFSFFFPFFLRSPKTVTVEKDS